jgi:UDP:flavonoid glycosyltransferase YjiC (YdhE family)
MASILFVTWDGGGNLPPALGIAAELKRRGHSVRFLGHERQRDAIEADGFGFEPYQHAREWSAAAPNSGFKGALNILGVFADRGPGKDLVASIAREPADLVVIDCLLFGALEAAERAGLRRAVLVHTFYGYMRDTWSRGPMGILARLKRHRPLKLWLGADLVLVTTLRELDPAGEQALPASIRYTGYVWQGGSARPRQAAGAEPLVLVSLSTTYFDGQVKAMQSILDALEGMPVRALVTTGPAVDPAELRTPGNAQLHRFLSHSALMPELSLVIGHGGHATTMLALAHDLPLVIMPMHPMLDQPMVGRALEAKGAARVVGKTAPPERIRSAIEEMLRDGPHREAAERLGAEIRRQDGAVEASDRLDALVAGASNSLPLAGTVGRGTH